MTATYISPRRDVWAIKLPLITPTHTKYVIVYLCLAKCKPYKISNFIARFNKTTKGKPHYTQIMSSFVKVKPMANQEISTYKTIM
jgi:hypothetical protein